MYEKRSRSVWIAAVFATLAVSITGLAYAADDNGVSSDDTVVDQPLPVEPDGGIGDTAASTDG
jgi:hypothetical protein